MQDILPQESHDGRSIRDIPVSQSRRTPAFMEAATPPVPGQPRRRGTSFIVKLLLVIIVACLLAVLTASFFTKATVAITIREMPVTVPAEVSAQLDAPVGTMPFQHLSVPGQAQRTVTASGSSNDSTPAQGTLTIYNTVNTAPQSLVANTRFEAPDGKIYKIQKKVTVPAATKNASGVVLPGSVQAIAVAEKPGADYNRADTRFTIPGFKSSPNFNTFYAQASGMTGGSSGAHPVVLPVDIQKAQADMKQELAQKFATSSAFSVSSDSLSIDGTVALEFGNVTVVDAGGGKATLTQTATATEATVRKADLATAIAKVQVEGYSGAAVSFDPASPVALSVSPGSVYTAQSSGVVIAVSGTPMLAWQFDPEQVRQALAGKNKSSFDTVMAGFAPAVSAAKASFIPIWNTTFPKDASKIIINVTTATK